MRRPGSAELTMFFGYAAHESQVQPLQEERDLALRDRECAEGDALVDADAVADRLYAVDRSLPHVAGAPLGPGAMQRDRARAQRDEHRAGPGGEQLGQERRRQRPLAAQQLLRCFFADTTSGSTPRFVTPVAPVSRKKAASRVACKSSVHENVSDACTRCSATPTAAPV